MYIFPRNEERKKQWAVAVRRADINKTGALWKPAKQSYLCEVSCFGFSDAFNMSCEILVFWRCDIWPVD